MRRSLPRTMTACASVLVAGQARADALPLRHGASGVPRPGSAGPASSRTRAPFSRSRRAAGSPADRTRRARPFASTALQPTPTDRWTRRERPPLSGPHALIAPRPASLEPRGAPQGRAPATDASLPVSSASGRPAPRRSADRGRACATASSAGPSTVRRPERRLLPDETQISIDIEKLISSARLWAPDFRRIVEMTFTTVLYFIDNFSAMA